MLSRGRMRWCGFAMMKKELADAVLRGLDGQRQRALQLAMARRLAEAPELFAAAAERYLPVIDAVDEAAEQSLVIALLRRAAEQAALTGDYALVNALSVAALQLVDPADTPTLIELHHRAHAALYSLGCTRGGRRGSTNWKGSRQQVLERADATSVQVHSLTHRKRFTNAVDLPGVASRAGPRRPGNGPACCPRLISNSNCCTGGWMD